MSYILDALKRADAERERGHVPGLHTRSTPEFDAPAPSAAKIDARQWLLALALLLGLGALATPLFWWLREPAAPAPTAVAPGSGLPTTPSTLTTQAITPPAPAPESPVELAPAAPPAPADRVDNRVDNRADMASQSTTAALPILAPEPVRPPLKPAPAEPPAAAGNAGKADAVRRFGDLTPEARAQLPAVNVNGSSYSKDPALRMLIVNGKVVQEGGEIAPGLTVETIEPRSAVLNHQGLRYRIGF